MQFYYVHMLREASDGDRTWLKLPAEMPTEGFLAQLCRYGNKYELINWDIKRTIMHDNTKAVLTLGCYVKDPKGNKHWISAASMSMQSVNSNCGAVHFSNCNSQYGKLGLGRILMTSALGFCKRAGYTFIHGNTAGDYQNKIALPWFQKYFGAKKMGKKYKNPRSGNLNQWFYINLTNWKVVY